MEKRIALEKNTLPLLDSLLSTWQNDFSRTLLLVCHHVLESNLILLTYFIKLGVKPQDIMVIGKAYSTSPKMVRRYESLGITLHPHSLTFDSHRSFDEQFAQYVNTFLDSVEKRNLSIYERILVLDDGGELLRQVNDRFLNVPLRGVEQTSSGYHKIKSIGLHFPVVSVASSWAKLEYESPMIAEAFVKELHKRLTQMDKIVTRVLVLGNGPIGSHLVAALEEDFDVFVYDKLPEKSKLSDEKLYEILPLCDVIIGCSGQTSVLNSQYSLLKKDAILVSASSSDREFESHKIRLSHEKTSNPHKDFYTDKVVLLNGGFPLNFDGYKQSIPNEHIQLTMALMFVAAIQSLQIDTEAGIVELDTSYQQRIIKEFERVNKN